MPNSTNEALLASNGVLRQNVREVFFFLISLDYLHKFDSDIIEV